MQKKLHNILTLLTVTTLIGLPCCADRNKSTKIKPKKEQKEKKAPAPIVEKTFNKKIEHLNFEEAGKARAYYKALDKKTQLAKSLERMISLSADHQVIDELLLELADVTFDLEKYPEAEAMYGQHAVLYPGSNLIDYVKARHIESSFRQVLDAARDQSKTKKTIKLSTKFIARFEPSNRHYKRIRKILDECYYIVLESENNQAAFYLQKYAYAPFPGVLGAAKSRLTQLKKEVLPNIDKKQAQDITEKIKTVEKIERDQLTREALDEIVQQIYELIQDFRGITAFEQFKKSIWSRF